MPGHSCAAPKGGSTIPSVTSESTAKAERQADALTIEPIMVRELREQGTALFHLHAEEVDPESSSRVLPQWDLYEAAQNDGRLLVLGAFVGETDSSRGRLLIGYAMAALVPSMHYADLTICQLDSIFVMRSWRSLGAGLRLIRALRDEARECGAERLIMHARDSRLERILSRLGFQRAETVYTETLR